MSMDFRIEAACASHLGRVRRNNEDNYYFSSQYAQPDAGSQGRVLYKQFLQQGSLCLAVFDGMGGLDGGEQAAYAAAQTFAHDCEQANRSGMLSETFFLNTVMHMNEAVCVRAMQERSSMGTTAVIAGFYEDTVYICNVGDSRAYRLRRGVLSQISQDHVGEIPPFMKSSRHSKPRLSQCIGTPPEELTIEPYIGRGTVRDGDTFLLCSDGLTDMLSDEEIAAVLMRENNAARQVERLVACALGKGGIDNVTVIVATARVPA